MKILLLILEILFFIAGLKFLTLSVHIFMLGNAMGSTYNLILSTILFAISYCLLLIDNRID